MTQGRVIPVTCRRGALSCPDGTHGAPCSVHGARLEKGRWGQNTGGAAHTFLLLIPVYCRYLPCISVAICRSGPHPCVLGRLFLLMEVFCTPDQRGRCTDLFGMCLSPVSAPDYLAHVAFELTVAILSSWFGIVLWHLSLATRRSGSVRSQQSAYCKIISLPRCTSPYVNGSQVTLPNDTKMDYYERTEKQHNQTYIAMVAYTEPCLVLFPTVDVRRPH